MDALVEFVASGSKDGTLWALDTTRFESEKVLFQNLDMDEFETLKQKLQDKGRGDIQVVSELWTKFD